tara:strand:- start:356 stop:1009 length:654 start_codon:yes stop_codon:yes gene_type:complete
MKVKNLLNVERNDITLVAVSKTKPVEEIKKKYNEGFINFGENRVNELVQKFNLLPKDINWHMIGHLQTNKVKKIIPFISLIHSVDSLKLIDKIENESEKFDKKTNILLQVHIAKEKSKYGFNFEEVRDFFKNQLDESYKNINIVGLMGMATFTNNKNQIRKEFKKLKILYDEIKSISQKNNQKIKILSMGMSSDYKIAIEEGSNMVRIGSLIFGERD